MEGGGGEGGVNKFRDLGQLSLWYGILDRWRWGVGHQTWMKPCFCSSLGLTQECRGGEEACRSQNQSLYSQQWGGAEGEMNSLCPGCELSTHRNTLTSPVVHLTDRDISIEGSFHFLPAQHAEILPCNCKCCLNIEGV